MQQRGIRSEALEALLDFGCVRHLHKGLRGRVLRQSCLGSSSQEESEGGARRRAALPYLRRDRLQRSRDHRRLPLPARYATLGDSMYQAGSFRGPGPRPSRPYGGSSVGFFLG